MNGPRPAGVAEVEEGAEGTNVSPAGPAYAYKQAQAQQQKQERLALEAAQQIAAAAAAAERAALQAQLQTQQFHVEEALLVGVQRNRNNVRVDQFVEDPGKLHTFRDNCRPQSAGAGADKELARDVFDRHDLLNSGFVPLSELQAMLDDLGVAMSDAELLRARAQLVPDKKDGEINCSSFVDWWLAGCGGLVEAAVTRGNVKYMSENVLREARKGSRRHQQHQLPKQHLSRPDSGSQSPISKSPATDSTSMRRSNLPSGSKAGERGGVRGHPGVIGEGTDGADNYDTSDKPGERADSAGRGKVRGAAGRNSIAPKKLRDAGAASAPVRKGGLAIRPVGHRSGT